MQYYKQRGDLMRDPEIVFDVDGEWSIVRYRLDALATDIRDDEGLPQHESFVEQWSENLRVQGFVDAAEERASQCSSD